jgi:hypothetical protein
VEHQYTDENAMSRSYHAGQFLVGAAFGACISVGVFGYFAASVPADREELATASRPPAQSVGDAMDRISARIRRAGHSADAGRAYRELNERFLCKGLNTVKYDEQEAGIQIALAWHRFRSSVPRVSSAFAFLGAVESAIGLKLPNRCEHDFIVEHLRGSPEIQTAAIKELVRAFGSARAWPVGADDGNDRWQRRILEMHVRGNERWVLNTPEDVQVATRGTRFTVSIGPRDAEIEHAALAEALNRFNLRFRYCVGEATADLVIVCFFDELPFSYPLICIDRQSSSIRWQRAVWAAGQENENGQIGGMFAHWVHVWILDTRIIIFGTSSGSGSYIEVFDEATGEAQCRFATNNWNIH